MDIFCSFTTPHNVAIVEVKQIRNVLFVHAIGNLYLFVI